MSCKWKSFGLSAFLALVVAGVATASVKHPPLPEPIREAIPELRPLGQGPLTWFGLALGADLAIPPSILADVIDWGRGGAGPAQEGGYFGLWSLVTQLNLALAAGIALPLLPLAGYQPGADNDAGALTALAAAYALIPCVLKALAAGLLLAAPLSAAPAGAAAPNGG